MTDDDPRPAELSRRIDEVGSRMDQSFRDVNLRLDRMPTNDILLAYLATRDQEMKTISENVKQLSADLAAEGAERRAADASESASRHAAIAEESRAREEQAEKDRNRAEATRRWAMGFAVTCGVALVGLATFIINVAGGAS